MMMMMMMTIIIIIIIIITGIVQSNTYIGSPFEDDIKELNPRNAYMCVGI